MKRPIKKPSKKRQFLVGAFVLALIAAIFFSVNIIVQAVALTRTPSGEIKPWMTVGYIARSIGLSAGDIDGAMGLSVPKGRGPTIEQLARDLGLSWDEMTLKIEEAIKAIKDATGNQ